MRQELPLPVPGSVVTARGHTWRVVDTARYADCGVCRLVRVPPADRDVRLALLVPFDRLAPIVRQAAWRRSGRRRWMRQFRHCLLEDTRDGALSAAAGACFDLLPYQLEPALAVLAGETRVLIADAVGLGKTVQAGLILAEVIAREPAARCLVMAPASLCPQWLAELRHRFALPAVFVDAVALRRLASLSPPGSLIWDQHSLAVTSFDFVKRRDVLANARDLRWDAVVVDEAHMAALAPERAAAVGVLARRARRVVLLTATPHASDTDGFRALCATGMLPGDPPIVMFRRDRPDIGLSRTRRTRLLRVRLSPAERRMHQALDRYTTDVWRETDRGRDGPDASLAMIVLRKRAASGPAALLASLSRRVALLSCSPLTSDAQQLPLPLEPADDNDPADDEPAAVLGAPGLRNPDAERALLLRLIDFAREACEAETKLGALARLLRRAREPAVVFTEYRDTLARIARRLEGTHRSGLLHGGLDQGERQAAIRAFNEGRTSVLLATDAAAHGLNLHARCRLVVNVELPWTPARLEQRVGRVDRIGQRRPVHAVHLVARDTAEEVVLARLVVRVERERAALGRADDPLGAAPGAPGADSRGEMEVARLLFEGEAELCASRPARAENRGPARADEDRHILFRRLDRTALASAERTRIDAIRKLMAGGRSNTPRGAAGQPPADGASGHLLAGGVRWCVVRRTRRLASLPSGLICLFTARFVDGRGSLVEQRTIALHVALAATVCHRRVLERALPVLLDAIRPSLANTAAREADAHLARLRSRAAERLALLSVREAAIGEAAIGRAPVQAGLFDKRATKRVQEEQRRRARDQDEAASHLDDLCREQVIELAGEPELVLVLGVAE